MKDMAFFMEEALTAALKEDAARDTEGDCRTEDITGDESDIAALSTALAQLSTEDPIAGAISRGLDSLDEEPSCAECDGGDLSQLLALLSENPGLKITLSF